MVSYRRNKRVLGFAAFACTTAASMATALAQAPILTTQAGHKIGVSVSGYKYDEPAVMSIKATKLGADYAGTFTLGNNWFARAEARYASGKGDYSSPNSGSKSNLPDRYTEARGVIGKDYAYGNDTLSPYAGFGYRYLFNDLRGLTSTGAAGYRRESTYLSLPVGITHQTKLASQARLLSSAEFAYLLRGEQTSKLSDMGTGRADITHRQRRGYGLRFGMSYQLDQWSMGPFINYWNIKDSDTVSALIEPHNKTTEFGFKAGYRF